MRVRIPSYEMILWQALILLLTERHTKLGVILLSDKKLFTHTGKLPAEIRCMHIHTCTVCQAAITTTL